MKGKNNSTTLSGFARARTFGWALVFSLLVCFSAQIMYAQAPGWSRGQQSLSLSYDDCVRRMPVALQNEGYREDPNSGGNFVAGTKGVHTAVIICSPAPESKMLVQIVVASNGDGGGVERQRLQAQMERPVPGNNGNGGSRGIDGNWYYQDSTSGFKTDQTWDPSGNTRGGGGETGRWAYEGNEVVVRWNNGWVNRYQLPIVSNVMSGIAIGPSGERHSITLTRR